MDKRWSPKNLLVLWTLFMFSSVAVKCVTEGPETLVESLLAASNINRILRPKAGGNATAVSLGISLLDIVYVKPDENEAAVSFVTWINLQWNDPRLAWDPEIYNIKTLRLPSSKIWTPDIDLYNSMDPTPELQFSSVGVVNSDGGVLFVSPNHLPVNCQIIPSKYAAQWNCYLKFGSWSRDGGQLNLTLAQNSADISSFNHHRWNITKNEATRNVVKYECCPEEYIDITYNITITKVE